MTLGTLPWRPPCSCKNSLILFSLVTCTSEANYLIYMYIYIPNYYCLIRRSNKQASFYHLWNQFVNVEQPGYLALVNHHFSTETQLHTPRPLLVCAVMFLVLSHCHHHSKYDKETYLLGFLCCKMLAWLCSMSHGVKLLDWTKFFHRSLGVEWRQAWFAIGINPHLDPMWHCNLVVLLVAQHPRKRNGKR